MGKLNIFLIGFLICLSIILVIENVQSDNDSYKPVPEKSPVRKKTLSQAAAEDISTSFEYATFNNRNSDQQERPASTGRMNKKQHKKVVSKYPVNQRENVDSDVSQTKINGTIGNTSFDESVSESQPMNDPSKNVIAFNLWSVAELRLRDAYAKLMNDSSKTSLQLAEIQKEYLDLVNRKAKICGQLEDRFSSNINTVEKLDFNDKSVKTLDCHTSENINELLRLNALGVETS